MHELRQVADNHSSRDCVLLQGRLCAMCADRLHQELRTLLEFYEESEQSLTPTPPRLSERVSGSRGSVGIVLDDGTVALRSRTGGVLGQWARLVVEEAGGRVPRLREPGMDSLVRFLQEHLSWLADHPAAADFDEEVAELLAAYGTLLDLGRVHTFPLGACPEQDCDGSLHGVMSAGGSGTPSRVSCDTGHILAPHQWLRVAVRLKGDVA